MRIDRIVLKNFFRYYGTQTIVFSKEDNKNVTVIRGENGTGKTTLLNAFYYVMYGDVMEPLKLDNMLNLRAAEELKEGEKMSASVGMEFEERNERYLVNREEKFEKINGKIIHDKHKYIEIYRIDSTTGNAEKEDDDFIEKIIPKRLRSFFFFDGERINKLAQVDGKEEIKKAILDILGVTMLDNMSKDLEQIKSDYTKELSRFSEGEAQEAADVLDGYRREKNIYVDKLEKEKENIKKEERVKERAKNYLSQCNSEVIREKRTQIEEIESNIASNKKSILNVNSDIKTLISSKLKVKLMSPYFEEILKVLDDKREKGQLPSNIKTQFLDDLLERGMCICGCHLEEGSEGYKNIIELKKSAGSKELDESYNQITGLIKSYKEYCTYSNEVEYEKDRFFNELSALKDLKNEYEGNIENLKYKKENLSQEIINSNDDKIKFNEQMLNKSEYNIKKISQQIGKLETEIERIDKKIKDSEEALIRVKNKNEKAQKIRDKNKIATELYDLNISIKEAFIEMTRQELDQEIKKVFSNFSRKEYRVPELTKDFELKILNTINNTTEDNIAFLSTGEGQITSLSFIGALVNYARNKRNKNILISEFTGGDYPIVMDSPFGNLDETHTANVASNIGKLASQIIIVVSDKQWSKEVEENIEHQVGKMYKMIDANESDKEIGETTKIEEVSYNG